MHRREWNLSSVRLPYHIVIAAVRGKLCKKVLKAKLECIHQRPKMLWLEQLSQGFSFLIRFLNFCMISNQNSLQSLKKGRIIGSRSYFLLFISTSKEAPFNKSFFVREVKLRRKDISQLSSDDWASTSSWLSNWKLNIFGVQI